MTDQTIVTLLAAPAVLALGWLVIRMALSSFLQASKAKKAWPALADSLGFRSLEPRTEGRTVGSAALEGRHRDRAVRLETGVVRGSGQNQAASAFTSWQTDADLGLSVEHLKILDRMLPQSDTTTGDEAFDKAFSITGDADTVTRVLTPPAREAITTYTKALGGFSLGAEGLRHRVDEVLLESVALTTVLDWQAWVLDALATGESQGLAPATAPRAAGTQASWPVMVAVAILFASGGATSVYTANSAKRQNSANARPVAAQLGDRVLANFRANGNWYPAVAVKATETEVQVVYADGAVETRASGELRPDALGAGDRVQAPRRGATAGGTVEERRGTAVRVRFADGTNSWLSLGQVYVADVDKDQPPSTQPPAVPEEVLANWKDEPWLYPGTVVGREGGRIHVFFQDGTLDWRTPEQVHPFVFNGGDLLELKVGDTWKAASYVQRLAGGHAVAVDLEGQITWTALARIRRPAVD
jgi:hypothetical protein